MIGAAVETLKELTRLLPAAVARLLLLLTLIGGAVLHFSSVRRIEILEKQHVEATANHNALLAATRELTDEVKLYRLAVLDENKALRRQ